MLLTVVLHNRFQGFLPRFRGLKLNGCPSLFTYKHMESALHVPGLQLSEFVFHVTFHKGYHIPCLIILMKNLCPLKTGLLKHQLLLYHHRTDLNP